MITYQSLFESTAADIINQTALTDFTPYIYGSSDTITEMPRYGTGTSEIYINTASIKVRHLNSNTPYMIMVTATNQFG